MLLSEARTRIRTLVDDLEEERWTNTQVDAALLSAQYEAILWAVRNGADIFRIESTITTSSAGVGDLASIKPLKVLAVQLVSGSDRVILKPLAAGQATSFYSAVQTLQVSHVPRPTFPAGPTAPFVWGSSAVSCPPVDSFMCLLAASELQITEGAQMPGLEARKAELKAALVTLVGIPTFTVQPLRSQQQRASIGWCATGPDTIQLARL